MARIALLFHSYQVGGVARNNIRLAREFLARGHAVDMVLGTRKGELREERPVGAKEIILSRTSRVHAVAAHLRYHGSKGRISLPGPLMFLRASKKVLFGPSLANYLKNKMPDVVISSTAPLTVSAVQAKQISRTTVKIIATEHNTLSILQGNNGKWRYNIPPSALRQYYVSCGAVITVSQALKDEISRLCDIPPKYIRAIPNPIVDETIQGLSGQPPPHPWLREKQIPTIVSVGKLNWQKDYPTLLRALAKLNDSMEARLIVVGGQRSRKDEEYSSELQRLAADLGISSLVDFVGHKNNPFTYMRHASLFVLSSRQEAFGNVLVEAMACGCPVVSTDCPGGPREILREGLVGPLVPVGDWKALALAMQQVLLNPPSTEQLTDRASDYSVSRIADKYLAQAQIDG